MGRGRGQAGRTAAGLVLALLGPLGLGACTGGGRIDQRGEVAFVVGEYARAAEVFQGRLTNDRSDRSYILDRERLLLSALADGQARAADEASNETFSILRVQGLNADKTVSSVVVNEGVKIWKGEPFEQALGFHYVALQKAMVGEWDNARAAAGASLFLLKDFGENERGEKVSTLEIARNAQTKGDQYFDKGYAATRTDFALGYVIGGIANRAIGRDDEAGDNFNEAARVNPALERLRDALLAREYNCVFVVDYGRGPRKAAYGPDGALARFVPLTAGDRNPLTATLRGEGGAREDASYPPVCDVNAMAQSHLWNNLEDVRVAKSMIGTALMEGGMIVAATSGRDRGKVNEAQLLAGLGAVLAGAIMKSGAAADTRHLELLPQRVYVVPMRVESRGSTLALQVEGDEQSRLVLAGIDPPRSGELELRYVRLGSGRGSRWAQSGRVVYANDAFAGPVEGDDLPFILGGRDVSRPSQQVLSRYQAAGHLEGMTTVELENLYREEGIKLSPEDLGGKPHRHILEGGDSLVPPLAGTAGYARLFCQEHAAYQARSAAVKEIAGRLAGRRGAGARD